MEASDITSVPVNEHVNNMMPICNIDIQNELTVETFDSNSNLREKQMSEQTSSDNVSNQRTINDQDVNNCQSLDRIVNINNILLEHEVKSIDENETKITITEKESEKCKNTDQNVEIGNIQDTKVIQEELERRVNNKSLEDSENEDIDDLFEDSENEEKMEAETGCRLPEINYSFAETPTQITGCWQEFQSAAFNNFLKGCKWSPDGSCILTNSEDHILRLFNLPNELYGGVSVHLHELNSVLKITEGDLIYDYCWFPNMSSLDPLTCCLASTCRDHPIHMWDAYTGELRCTYSAYNHLDEVVTAHCLAFDPFGTKLFCGFNKSIKVFDVERPGRDFEDRPTYKKKQGQAGIISCIAMCPALENLYAAGSYSKSIGLYTEPNGEVMCLLQGQVGGVTHLCFSPDGTKLYSGGRKDPEILCWDLRNLGKVLYTLARDVITNQRIYFDLDCSGRYVISGHQGGIVTIWDTTIPPTSDIPEGDPILVPLLQFAAHSDAVNGVSFHPSLPLLVTSSGQRKYADVASSSEDSSDDEVFTDKNIVQDNSLRLWWLGPNELCSLDQAFDLVDCVPSSPEQLKT